MRADKYVPSLVSSLVTLVAVAAIGGIAACASSKVARTVATLIAEVNGYGAVAAASR